MGRRRKLPTTIARVRKSDLERVRKIAKATGKTITEVWSDLIKMRYKNVKPIK